MLIAVGVSVSGAGETDLRLHLAWGGGSQRQWHGRVSLSGGTFQDLRLLGMEVDGPGSILLQGQQILIEQPRSRSYDGMEVTVRAPEETVLRVELLPLPEIQARVIDVPLRDLVHGYHSEALDEEGNRLVLRRAPGDSLRLRFDRDHLGICTR